MSALDLARMQFAITTVYHFLFVPLTISMGFIVASFQTAWFRTNKEKYLKLTHFFGELFLINFALGVVTGILQEFQFGMNWSQYSRFVGDIFGAPLAIEALLAFFLESTFLGIWIFGWDRVNKKIHLAAIWLTAFGSLVSALWILIANAWMQNPVGYKLVVHNGTQRAELTDFIAVITNPNLTWTLPHVIAASFMTGGAFVLAISIWRMIRKPDHDSDAFRSAAKVGGVLVVVAAVVLLIAGDQAGKYIAANQPMKLATAEGLYNTTASSPLSLFAIWGPDGKQLFDFSILPGLGSFLATGDFNGTVQGINNIVASNPVYAGMENSPIVPVDYMAFRLMVGVAGLAALAALFLLFSLRKGRTPGRPALLISFVLPFLPLAANSAGWVLRELGRQPWVVQGLQQTKDAVSPNTGMMVVITLVTFTALYGILAVVELGLIRKVVTTDDISSETAGSDEAGEPAVSFGY